MRRGNLYRFKVIAAQVTAKPVQVKQRKAQIRHKNPRTIFTTAVYLYSYNLNLYSYKKTSKKNRKHRHTASFVYTRINRKRTHVYFFSLSRASSKIQTSMQFRMNCDTPSFPRKVLFKKVFCSGEILICRRSV